MNQYNVRAVRSGPRWAITVVELPGVFSQARRLDRVESMARDAIALLLEVEPDSFGLVVEPALPSGLDADVTAATRIRADVERLQEESSRTLRHAARNLVRSGVSVRDAGTLLGLSHQRVSQLVRSRQPT